LRKGKEEEGCATVGGCLRRLTVVGEEAGRFRGEEEEVRRRIQWRRRRRKERY
jgi:hypothetical protein